MQNESLDVMRLRGWWFRSFSGPRGQACPEIYRRLLSFSLSDKPLMEFNDWKASLFTKGEIPRRERELKFVLFPYWWWRLATPVMPTWIRWFDFRNRLRLSPPIPATDDEGNVLPAFVDQCYIKPSLEWRLDAEQQSSVLGFRVSQGPRDNYPVFPKREKEEVWTEKHYADSIYLNTPNPNPSKPLTVYKRPNLKHKVSPEVRKYWARQPNDYGLPVDVNKHGRYTKVLWLYVDRMPRPPNTDVRKVLTSRHLGAWCRGLQWKAANCIDTVGKKGLSGGWKIREEEDVRKTPLKYWRARRLARKMAEDFRAAKVEKKKVRKAKKQWARVGCQTYAQWQESMGLHTSTFCED